MVSITTIEPETDAPSVGSYHFLIDISYPGGYHKAMSKHSTHPEIIKRLRRAEGHLKSVLTMLEEGRSCLDIAQQLQAVESAITNAKRTLIHDHIEHCLEQTLTDRSTGRKAVVEFKNITKYL